MASSIFDTLKAHSHHGLMAALKNYSHRAIVMLMPIARVPGPFLDAPLAARLQGHQRAGEPSWEPLGWQLPTAAQMQDPVFAKWSAATRTPLSMHRKYWEWAYIMQALDAHGLLREGKRGLGFAVGKEPLTAAIASMGCSVVATDLDFSMAEAQGWVAGDQHIVKVSQLNDRGICDPDAFARRVEYRECDMNAIPEDLRRGEFDFVWSACAFEHLGSIDLGLRFVEQAMACLRPGGIAVHTTEFNLGSNDRTLALPHTVAFRKLDIEALAIRLLDAGHSIGTINFSHGSTDFDQVADLPPYSTTRHLKLLYHRHLITSIGLYAQRGQEPAGI